MTRWAEIPGYSRYEVSCRGRVRNKITKKVLVTQLKGKPGADYLYVHLTPDEGCAKKLRLHRVVALAFHPNEANLPVVDHIDQNRFNNRASNLRWVTDKQNARNRRNNHWVTLNGETRLMMDVVKELVPEFRFRGCYTAMKKRMARGESFLDAFDAWHSCLRK